MPSLVFSPSSGVYRYFEEGQYGDDYDGVCSVNINGASAHLFGAKMIAGRVTIKVLLGVYAHLMSMGIRRITADRVSGRRLPLADPVNGEWVVDLTDPSVRTRVLRSGITIEEVAHGATIG